MTITKDDPVGIRKTTRSVAEQAFTDYEHIVLDGGSDVDVAAFLQRWRDERPDRRILVENPPRGIYPSMNEGLRGTQAPLVVILNGGDELTPGALGSVVQDRSAHGWEWGFGQVRGKDERGNLRDSYGSRPFSRTLLRTGLQPVPHQAAYVSRAAYDRVGLYREDLGTAADQEFFLRLSAALSPRQLSETLAFAETWGVSNRERMLGRELTWHRLRIASGTAFGGRWGDLLVTLALLGRVSLLRIARAPRGLLRRLRRSN